MENILLIVRSNENFYCFTKFGKNVYNLTQIIKSGIMHQTFS